MASLFLTMVAAATQSNVQMHMVAGRDNIPTVQLTHPSGASCEVVLAGAHVTSWKTDNGVERLFVSSASEFAPGAAIRGGIPICFPQFSGRGTLPKHGFARTSTDWKIDEEKMASDKSKGDECKVVLSLSDTEASRAIWPHCFELRYTVALSGTALATTIELVNRGDGPLDFTTALHTYFAANDVNDIRVEGLSGLTYEDNAAGGANVREAQTEVIIAGEVDRVYLDAPSSLLLRGTRGGEGSPAAETISMQKGGFPDVVLWNLGELKAPSMADLGSGEWRKYVCLEAGAIGRPVTLQPGESFVGSQRFCVT